MQQIISLFLKDFMAFFRTYLGYAVIFVYMSMSMIFTFYGGKFFMSYDSSFYSFFLVQPYVMSFIIPLIATRVFSAEEDKNGGFEFLLTQPLKYKVILLGKLWAIYAFVCLLIVLSIPQVVAIGSYIKLNYCIIFSSYCGLLLFALAISVLCCLINSSINNVFVAYITATSISLILCNADFTWITYGLLKLFGLYSPSVIYALSFEENYLDFIRGRVSLSAIMFFFTITILFGFIGYNIFARSRNIYKKSEVAVSGVIACVAFVLFMLATKMIFFRSAIDLTEDKDYTINNRSYDISNTLDQKVHIKLYLSDGFSDEYRNYEQYISYVSDMLAKYASNSPDISFEIINPKPYSQQEQEAKEYNLEPIVSSDGSNLYFGAVFLAADNSIKTIPLFIKDRKYLLEADITFALKQLSKGYRKPIIGIAAPNLPVLKTTYNKEFAKLAFVEKLSENYILKRVSDGASEISEDIDVLLIINPHEFSPVFSYALDQYIIRGGNVVIFADPYPETEMKYAGLVKPRPVYLNGFLRNYGLIFIPDFVATNYQNAAKMFMNENDKFASYDYPLWLNLEKENIVFENVRGKTSSILLETAGTVEPLEQEGVSFEPIINIENYNGLVETKLIRQNNPALNKSKIDEIDFKLTLGAFVKGRFKSAYEERPSWEDSGLFLQYSLKPSIVAVIADSDFLFNDAVIKKENTIRNEPYLFIEKNDNLQFLHNLMLYITGEQEDVVIAKSAKNTDKLSVENLIKYDSRKEYSQQLSKLSAELSAYDYKIKQLEELSYMNRRFMSPEEIKDYNDLKSERKKIEEEKRKIEYYVEREYEKTRSALVAKTILWIPFIITLLSILIAYAVSLFKKKYVRRIF